MARITFRPDHREIARYLQTDPELRQVIHDAAVEVARNIDRTDLEPGEVVVDDYATDRVASSVTVRHPGAQFWQARDGLLTKAAARAGLEVKAR